MPYQTRIPEACKAFGLKVVEVDGWRTRGRSSFTPRAVVAHHTANGPGEIGSLRVLIHGRSDLPGPLCQVGLGRSGTVYVIAAGVANHAGSGGWKGISGNSNVFGIEAENRGGAGDPWPAVQLDAYYRLCAALLTLCPVTDSAFVCGHKEWAPNRKVDPHSLNMTSFRAKVQAILDGEEDDLPYTEEQLKKIVADALSEDPIIETLADRVRRLEIRTKLNYINDDGERPETLGNVVKDIKDKVEEGSGG